MTPHQTTTAELTGTIPGPATYMCGLTWDGTLLWHSDQGAEQIYGIDPRDGTVVRQFPCAHVRADLAFDGDRLCQIGGRPKRLVLIDRSTGEVTGEKAVPPASGRLTGAERGPEGMWTVLRGPTVVQLRDATTMAVLREFPVRGESPSGLTYADGVVVHGDFDAGTLSAMDPVTGEHLGTVAVPGKPTGLAWDGRRLWYCDFAARAFSSLDLSAVLDAPAA